jgi:hypothetical protein
VSPFRFLSQGLHDDHTLGAFLPGEVVTSVEIIQAHRLLIARARAQVLAVYGATLPPFMGVVPPAVFPELDAKRRAVNKWIRSGGEYDAVIDFDEVLRDPCDHRRLLSLFDSGDHLLNGSCRSS